MTSPSVAGAFEDWLQTLALSEPERCVFWAWHGWRSDADWHVTTSVEQLAVRISTTWRPHGEVGFVSASPGRAGRSVGVIALISRDELGWALNLNDGTVHCGDVRRADYDYDNYDSFSALTAAQISWSWVVTGTIPEGLALRKRW